MSVPIGPCWAQPSFRDDTWAANTWGAAVAGVQPTIPDVRIGAGSNTGGGFELYAAMRAAEADRRAAERPIASIVELDDGLDEPALVPPLGPPRLVVQLEPADLDAAARALERLEREARQDFGSEAVAVVEPVVEAEPEPDPPFSDAALERFRGRAEQARERQHAIGRSRDRLFAMGAKPAPRTPTSPVAFARALADLKRQLVEEAELAYVLLIAS